LFQAEYSDLSSKYQNVLLMLQEEKQHREGLEKEFRNREHQHQTEVETLKTQQELAVKSLLFQNVRNPIIFLFDSEL
jgi:hypothetical protein